MLNQNIIVFSYAIQNENEKLKKENAKKMMEKEEEPNEYTTCARVHAIATIVQFFTSARNTIHSFH